MSLEQVLEFLNADELAEITPTQIRIRKRLLDENDRKRAAKTTGRLTLSSKNFYQTLYEKFSSSLTCFFLEGPSSFPTKFGKLYCFRLF